MWVASSSPLTRPPHLLTHCLRASWKHLSCCVCVRATKRLARGTTTDSNHLEFSPVLTFLNPPSRFPSKSHLDAGGSSRGLLCDSSGAEGSNTDWIRLCLQELWVDPTVTHFPYWVQTLEQTCVCVEPMWPKHAQVSKLNPGNKKNKGEKELKSKNQKDIPVIKICYNIHKHHVNFWMGGRLQLSLSEDFPRLTSRCPLPVCSS